ncbi:MAG: hypothetical protein H7039_00015, partial [Bryobacteraceae bacterium]|nr:hypothetical protein [Bryobacteraceae bacterium]
MGASPLQTVTANMQKQLEITRVLHFDELRKFGNVEGPCITVYLHLEPSSNTSRSDFQRLKGVIRQAEQKLQEGWPDLSRPVRLELIESLHQVEAESDKWGGHGGSLAILRSPGIFRAFEVQRELDETAVVGDFFHVFPMLHAIRLAEQQFYVLALSQKHVRLLKCTNVSSEEVPFPAGTPTSIATWLNTGSPTSGASHGPEPNAEPGSTVGSFTSTQDRDNKDEHIANFYRQINKAVTELLKGANDPLVLCGVEYERHIYSNINDYPNLWTEGVQGSPESLKGGEMHARALEAVQDFFAQPARKALENWERHAGGGRATFNFPEIVKAAFESRIAQ